MTMTKNIHKGQPVLQYGTNIEDAELAVILLHGRGATAESMGSLADALHTDGISFLAPQAALNRWYPNTAFGPLEANKPDLTFALDTVAGLVNELRKKGFSDRQIAFGGFSQGACLAAEYLIRNPQRYGGLFVFSGARIGPPRMLRSDDGSFDGMPVFIGGSDVDPWVKHDLLIETAGIFKKMGANVDFRTYPGMGHTVNQDEIDAVRAMLITTKSLVAV
jgi:predicted esterase